MAFNPDPDPEPEPDRFDSFYLALWEASSGQRATRTDRRYRRISAGYSTIRPGGNKPAKLLDSKPPTLGFSCKQIWPVHCDLSASLHDAAWPFLPSSVVRRPGTGENRI